MSIEPKDGDSPDLDPLDEAIFNALETHGALPTESIASSVDCDDELARERLLLLSKTGLIERRETTKQNVWLTWKQA